MRNDNYAIAFIDFADEFANEMDVFMTFMDDSNGKTIESLSEDYGYRPCFSVYTSDDDVATECIRDYMLADNVIPGAKKAYAVVFNGFGEAYAVVHTDFNVGYDAETGLCKASYNGTEIIGGL